MSKDSPPHENSPPNEDSPNPKIGGRLGIVVAVNYSCTGGWNLRHCVTRCCVSFSIPLITQQI